MFIQSKRGTYCTIIKSGIYDFVIIHATRENDQPSTTEIVATMVTNCLYTGILKAICPMDFLQKHPLIIMPDVTAIPLVATVADESDDARTPPPDIL